MNQSLIRNVRESDIPEIIEIYNPFITKTTVSFEEEPVSAQEMQRRIRQVQDQGLPWYCIEVEDKVAGYAYASRWRERPAYRFTVETTIYLSPTYTGRGIGRSLFSTLLEQVRALGMHQVIAVITLPNPASVSLHEKLGFRKVAHFSEVGYKFNQWLDVGYWQRAL